MEGVACNAGIEKSHCEETEQVIEDCCRHSIRQLHRDIKTSRHALGNVDMARRVDPMLDHMIN